MNFLKGVALVCLLTLAASCASAQGLLRMHGQMSVSGLPTITPGSTALGSWSATATPGPQGNVGDFGYAEKPVMTWDLPDFSDYATAPTLCVHADHLSGMSYVAFAMQGGGYQNAAFVPNSPNAPSPIGAWCAKAGAFGTDQSWEARAIGCPITGQCMVLQGPGRDQTTSIASLYGTQTSLGQLFHGVISVYPGGTDSAGCGVSGGASGACLTISQAMNNLLTAGGGDVGGGTVCLGPNVNADYRAARQGGGGFPAANRYPTITTCPGVTKSQVVFTSGDNTYGIGADKVHLKSVSFKSTWPTEVFISLFRNVLFAEDVNYVGPGRGVVDANTFPNGIDMVAGSQYTLFGRDLDISYTSNGFGNCALAVRVVVHEIASDSFSNCYAVLDDPTVDSIYHVEPAYTPFGAAVYVTGNTHSNATIDGISDTSQFEPGDAVFDNISGPTGCFPGGAGTVRVTAKTANSLTTSPGPLCTENGAILTTASHADVHQDVENVFCVTTTAGSANISFDPVCSGASGFGPFVGALIWDSNAATFQGFTRVVSVDPVAKTGVMNKTALLTQTGAGVTTGRTNVWLSGIKATNWVNAQGLFQGPDMADYAANNITIDDRTAPSIAAGFTIYNWHTGGHWENGIFRSNTFLGSNASVQTSLNFLMKDTVCGAITGTHTGITYVNSVLCQ